MCRGKPARSRFCELEIYRMVRKTESGTRQKMNGVILFLIVKLSDKNIKCDKIIK